MAAQAATMATRSRWWMLGLGLACAFAILNAMWFELYADDEARRKADERNPPR